MNIILDSILGTVEKQIQILFTYEYTVTAYEAVQIILYFLKT
jgi:hypothetical protein